MTPASPTGRALYLALRRAGVTLTANGDRLAFEGPATALTPAVVTTLRDRKAELLSILNGDYLAAAAALLIAMSNGDRQDAMPELFDERAAIVEFDGNAPRAEAERLAYCELCRVIETAGLTSAPV